MRRSLLYSSIILAITVVQVCPAFAGPDLSVAKTAETRFNLHFRGGSLERLIAQMQRDPRANLNVMLSPEARKFRIDELKLKSVSAEDVILAVAKAYSSLELKKQGGITVISVQPADKVRFRMFSLKTMLPKVGIEDLNTLIRNAWELTEMGSKAKLRYHKETSILIVAGLPAEIEVVETVLNELATK